MNFLRSSPLSFFAPASLLQKPIFCFWSFGFSAEAAAGVASPPFKQLLMNFLRSPPLSFFSLASLLQSPILLCCALIFFSAAGGADFSAGFLSWACATDTQNRPAISAANNWFMVALRIGLSTKSLPAL